MKIVCDACQAKYSISDDKVQGKVFKIRCKKCSNIIVVRGGANAAEAAPPPQQEKETHVYDYGYDGGGGQPAGDEAVWHVVINQDQVGPMTAAEVKQRFSAGEIDAETYAWREGFADWLPLAQVDAFANLGGGAPASGGAAGGGGRDAVSAMFGGGSGSEDAGTMRSDPGDLFAAASASSRASGGDDDGGDLFGSRPASSSAQCAGRAPQFPKDAKLRGERNENSVLFSLNNLAQLASDTPAVKGGATMTSTPSGHATGAAGGEGSGLIDIRSMANAYLGSTGASAKPASAGVGTIDDLPVFGGGGFSEPAVIVPTSRPAANNKILYAMIGAVGFLAVAAVIMVVVLLGGSKNNNNNNGASGNQVAKNDDKSKDTDKSGDDSTKPTNSDDKPKTGDDKAMTPPPPTPPTATNGSGSGSAAPTTTTTPTQVAKNDPPKQPDKPKTPDVKKPDPKPPTTTQQVAKNDPPKPDTNKKPDATATKPDKDAGGCDEVSCVLNNYDGACCQKFKKGGNKAPSGGNTSTATTPAPTGGASNLPDALDRDMISNGVGKVKARA